MAAGLSSKNPILMQQTHEIDIAGIKKVGGCLIGCEIVFGYLESHPRRVAVPRLRVIDGYHQDPSSAVLNSNCITQICCEGRNSTLSGNVVSDNRYTYWKRHIYLLCSFASTRMQISSNVRKRTAFRERIRGQMIWAVLPLEHAAFG
jgi:hypothetical protein